jgi:hypothetical protein
LNLTLKTEKQSFNINNLRFAILVRILDDNLDATPICIKCGHAKDLHKFSNMTHDYYECTSATTKQWEDDVLIDIDASCDCKKYLNKENV